MRIDRFLFQTEQALLLWVSVIDMRSDPEQQVADALLKTAGRLRTENPILRPLTTVDVPLRVVVADRFFFWDIICVAGDPRTFCRMEILALWAGTRSELGR